MFIILITLCASSCSTGERNDSVSYVEDAEYIQIVLFHLAQRCESCNAVEKETNGLLEEEYAEEISMGKLKFVPMNFQSEKGKKIARQLQAAGQTLLVVKGDSITNLTKDAFVFASTHPEHYREALRNTLDKYLK